MPNSDLTLRQVFQILNRRRSIVYISVIVGLVCAIILSSLTTRRYQAVSLIQLQKSNTGGLNLESLAGASGATGDALTANVDLETQAQILQSDAILLRLIKDEGLDHNPDFQPHFGLIAWLRNVVHPGPQIEAPGTPLEFAPRRRERLLAIVRANEKVTILSGSRIIAVSYRNQSPSVAAACANDLVRALSEYTFRTKFEATNEASTWLEKQLGDLRKQSTELEARVIELQKRTGLYGIGGQDLQGKQMVYSPILDRLQQSNAALAQAESDLLVKGAIARVARSRDADQISQLSGTGLMSSAAPGVQGSLQLIENLRTQESTLQQQTSKDAAIFGSSYPRLIEERAALAQVQNSLSQEIGRISERAQNDYVIAQQTENGLRTRFEQDREEAEKLNDRTIEYSLLAKEADQSQILYNDLLRRLHEAGILEGLRSSNISVVSAALVPASPVTPNLKLYLLMGPLAGLILGVGSAFFFDSIDNKIRGPQEIEAEGIPLLGVIPFFTRKSPGIPMTSRKSEAEFLPELIVEPHSSYAEAVRALRSNLLISKGEAPPKVVMLTSAAPAEGKSTLSINLALALAKFQKEVLLVEVDLRRPVLATRLGMPELEGLSIALSNSEHTPEYRMIKQQPYLKIITCGPRPPFPAELLASSRMATLIEEWRQKFDYVILDAPPILPVADAHPLIERSDFAILVARADVTVRAGFHRAFEVLKNHRNGSATGVGAVLNGISLRSASYSGYYGSYNSYEEYDAGGEHGKTQ